MILLGKICLYQYYFWQVYLNLLLLLLLLLTVFCLVLFVCLFPLFFFFFFSFSSVLPVWIRSGAKFVSHWAYWWQTRCPRPIADSIHPATERHWKRQSSEWGEKRKRLKFGLSKNKGKGGMFWKSSCPLFLIASYLVLALAYITKMENDKVPAETGIFWVICMDHPFVAWLL